MSIDAAPSMGRVRIWYPRLASTMDVTMALGTAGAPHGTLVEAGEQTSGRGRHGRAWVAPAGSAFLGSWLLRTPPGIDLAALSPAVAAAVLRAVEALAPAARVAYKWPNDVLVNGRKIAGILLTARAAGDCTLVVAGIGINVLEASVPSGLPATCLSEWADVSVDDLRQRLAFELEAMWGSALAEGGLPAGDRKVLEARMAFRGEPIELLLPDGAIHGIANGLSPHGGLRLGSLDGRSERVLTVGEIVRGPRGATEAGGESTVYFPEQQRS
jgi:BirA family biotin operon repressor/biotin-[acetyl-CoA-carboxylase] ligase